MPSCKGNFLVVPKDYCVKNTKFTMQCEEVSQGLTNFNKLASRDLRVKQQYRKKDQ